MGLAYNTSIPRESLSIYFDPANSKSYPGSGTTIFDLSGNGNNGTIGGAPVISNGYITFDGTDDDITITSNQTSLDFSQNQTIIMWMYHTFTSGRRNPYDQAYGGYGTWTHESGSNINYYYGNAGSNAQPYTSRNSGSTARSVWNMMSTTRSVSTVRWYNGNSLVNTAANAYGTLATTTANIRIGVGYAGRWIGNMGPVLVFKKELSHQEINLVYEAFRGRFGV